MTPPAPDKKQVLLSLLQDGMTMIHLDARRPGVRVPQQHSTNAQLNLSLSYRYNIPDLVIDDDKVQATLSFGGRPFQCLIPWAAIYAMTSQVSGRGEVWDADLPGEPLEAAPPPAPVAKKAPALAAVKSAKDLEPQKPVEAPKPPDGAPRRHLRLVR